VGPSPRVAFSPDGRAVLAVSKASALLWRGVDFAPLRGHEGEIADFAFSPDGTVVATVSGDRVQVWDAAGRSKASLPARGAPFVSVSFSPDGRRLLTASSDGLLRLWRFRAEDLLALADARRTREFTPEERRVYWALLGLPPYASAAAVPRSSSAPPVDPLTAAAAERALIAAEEKAAATGQDEVARGEALLAEFPPGEWGPDRAKDILTREVVGGVMRSEAERRFLENLVAWKAALARREADAPGPEEGGR
jgi:hypothetical protein